MKRNRERGAIVIEATISLTAFVFVIFTLLMVVNIYYIQSKISVALNTAAKELSEYSFLYFKVGLAKVDSAVSEDTEEARGDARKTIDGLAAMNNAINGAGNSLENLDFDGFMDNVNNGIDAGSSMYDMYSQKLSEDPSGFIGGMALMGADELLEEGKSALMGGIIGKAFMQKNLSSGKGDTPDAFLRRYRVIDGLNGLDFNYTTYLPGGTSSYIQLVCSYDVRVIKLLNIDFKFHFRQAAMTNTWATGISLIHKETNVSSESASIWDHGSSVTRHDYIRNQERKDYPYIATDQGFDAYNNNDGKNEFMSVLPLDLPKEGGEQEDIAARLNALYTHMEQSVSKLDKEIDVQDQSGKTHTIESDPDTRTYSIVIVVPDNASQEAVNKAVEQFKKDHPEVNVEVKTGYGSPTPEDGGGESGGGESGGGESGGGSESDGD